MILATLRIGRFTGQTSQTILWFWASVESAAVFDLTLWFFLVTILLSNAGSSGTSCEGAWLHTHSSTRRTADATPWTSFRLPMWWFRQTIFLLSHPWFRKRASTPVFKSLFVSLSSSSMPVLMSILKLSTVCVLHLGHPAVEVHRHLHKHLLQLLSGRHMQTRHVKSRCFRSGTRTCSFLAFCSNFRKALSQTMLHGFMISRTHVLAATIVQHGRGRDHGHIQCCFLPSLELGQIWQSVVQPFRLRLNVCRIQRSYSEKHHRSFSIMAVSRNRCCTTEWNTTQSSPQEQKPLPATKRSTHENTKG